ncbi:ABC transporter permease subunit [Agromyces larvae]|uniref:ABC transporter permease n=1 Tax=Agromyces larvae TaxID=2929802 RepID=A0ABY4BYS6_9MICO|nr:ABC transporter permease subunit [Agromyces larvae]UOE44049.1 ABC transporter permease [Agromyces larvae]
MSALDVPAAEPRIRLTFPGIARSEWIKLRTVRSTVWIAAVTFGVMVGLATFLSWGINGIADTSEQPIPSATILTAGVTLAQLTLGVLGVLLVTGEYANGSIRATLSAVPRRPSVLAAKTIVAGLTTLVLAAVSVGAAFLASQPILATGGTAIDLADGEQVRAIVGGVLYLTLVTLFSVGIGAIVTHTAGAICVVVGVFFALPILVQVVQAIVGLDWLGQIHGYLPSVAGQQIMTVGGSGGFGSSLDPWAGLAVLAGYAALSLVTAFWVFNRRDD